MSGFDHRLWNALPVPAFVVDAAGRITECNPAGESFVNLSHRAMTGSLLVDRLGLAAGFAAALEGALARALRDQSPVFFNGVDIAAAGKPGQGCRIQISPFSPYETTDNAEADQLLVLCNPGEFATQLGRQMPAPKAAKSAIGMAEMLAHEIKNPLAGISGAAQLLSMGLSGEDFELTELIVAEVRRVTRLLEQVETFGNLLPPDLKPVNIHDVLDRARRSALVGFGARVHFEEDYDPSLPPVIGDLDQLLQVVLNLLKNSAEALMGHDDPRITIRSYYDSGLRIRRADGGAAHLPLHLEIIDNGPGLPDALADHIFDPFVSGRENGTGLGLALVSKIIADHGGWITVDSHPGRTAFRVSLPIAPRSWPTKTQKEMR